MKTHYKFIYFEVIEEKPKTKIWGCFNNSTNNRIGEVKWYPSWRQYCFLPEPNTVYNVGCMQDICHFISQL